MDRAEIIRHLEEVALNAKSLKKGMEAVAALRLIAEMKGHLNHVGGYGQDVKTKEEATAYLEKTMKDLGITPLAEGTIHIGRG